MNVKKINTEKKNPLSGLFDMLGGIFKPILSIMIASGIIQAIRDVLVLTGVINQVSSSYIFLNAIGDCVFYFLPIYLAFSSAQIFGASPYMAAAIAGFLVYPQVTNLFNWSNEVGWNLTFFGVVPVTYAKYTSSVLPIILIVYAQSKIEIIVRKIVPEILKTILVPVLTMFASCFLGLTILGPIGTWIGDGLSAGIGFINGIAPWLVYTLIGAFSPFLVLTGSHYSLFPVATNNLATLGYDTVMMPGNLASNISLAGTSFAVAIKSKNPKYKSYCASAGITSCFGISQSSLYGIAIPLKKPLIAAVIGGGVAGFFAGITQIKCYSFMTPGLLSLIGYFKPEAGIQNFIFAIITCVIAFAATFIITLIIGFDEPDDATVAELSGEKVEIETVVEVDTITIEEEIDSEVIKREEISVDEVIKVENVVPLERIDVDLKK